MNKLVDRHMDILHADGNEPYVEPIIDEPGNAILDLDQRLTQLEQQVAQIALNTLRMAEHIRDLRKQSTAAPQSAIILPDRFN